MNQKYEKSVSKYLSYVLRHAPTEVGLSMDEQGWVDIDELIAKSSPPITRQQIEAAVTHNEKQRFVIEGNRIRANQGHSVDVDLRAAEVTPPDYLYHGTAETNALAIYTAGIKKMERQHVHLATTAPAAREVGQRHGKPKVMVVEARLMHDAGHKFWISRNGVYLTDFVPPEFIE